MAKQQLKATRQNTEARSLRRRIRSFYGRFNEGDWERCYQCTDPNLRNASRIELATYAGSLRTFKEHYGGIHIHDIGINLYLNVRTNKHDDCPFAYVYVFWQDDKKVFHLFRERWVKDGGRWYTRVVGLVAHKDADTSESAR